MTDRLDVTFEGPRVGEDGVPLDDFRKTLEQVQRALRLMVGHLAGIDPARGRPPDLVREQSALRLLGTSPGSLVAALGLAPPGGTQIRSKNLGREALRVILDSEGVDDPALPQPVRECFVAMEADLSPEIVAVSLGGAGGARGMRIERRSHKRRRRRETEHEQVLLYGLLMEVNWEQRTAQLHEPYGDNDRYVPLRFKLALGGDMQRLATQYVEVRGRGRFGNDDRWSSVQVEEMQGVRSLWEPFDREAFLNDPNPKIFRSEDVVGAVEPFDVDEFLRVIREGRDA